MFLTQSSNLRPTASCSRSSQASRLLECRAHRRGRLEGVQQHAGVAIGMDWARQWHAAAAASIIGSCATLLLASSPALAQECQLPPQPVQPNPLAIIAGLFSEERDPIDPFTLYGSTFKKFSIEQLDGEKIVSRKRGFTVDTCVASALENQESPSFNGLPIGEKVRASGNAECRRAEGADLKQTCVTSCEAACTAGLEKFETDNQLRTGFTLLEKDRTRLLRSCTRECATDCTRPGKSYSFVIPYRK